MRRVVFGMAVIVGTTLMFGATARAQFNDPSQSNLLQRLQALPVVDLKGTIAEIKPDCISMKCDGLTYQLAIAPHLTKVQCTGTAERSYLRPGVLVRFEGEFDKRMQPQGPIEELCVVTPSDVSQPGIHTDEPAEGEQPRAKQRGATEMMVVVGTIKLIKDDQLQVIADGKNVKVQLVEEVPIKVEIDDMSNVALGDEITVRGRAVQPAQDRQAGQVYGEDVRITLSQPLESTSKAPAKKKKASKSAKRVSK